MASPVLPCPDHWKDFPNEFSLPTLNLSSYCPFYHEHNMLFLSIATADEIFEDLLSALDWAVFPCRPCTPTTSISSSWFSGSPHCTSSAALQLHINPAEDSLMISRGGFFYVSLPTYQCVFTAQNPWLTSSFLFTLTPTYFWENWADSHSPPCLHSCSRLRRGKI